MTNYIKILEGTKKERESLLQNSLVVRGAQGKISLEEYLRFLTEAYHHVKHTVPLLMLCGAKLPCSKEGLRTKMAEYIEEELGHQEWILADIAACGGNKEEVRAGVPSIETELMVSYAYDVISRINPVGLLGMVLVLEGTSVAVATQAGTAIKSTLGLPSSAFSYLFSHGALDEGHTLFYEGIVNSLEPEDVEQVIHCAKVFYRLYSNIFTKISEGHK